MKLIKIFHNNIKTNKAGTNLTKKLQELQTENYKAWLKNQK